MIRLSGKWNSSYVAELVLRVVRTVTLVTALMMVVGAVINYGFPLTPDQKDGMYFFFRYVWIVFILDRVMHIIFDPHYIKSAFGGVGLVMNVLLILTVLPLIVPSLVFFGSSLFRNGVLLLLSLFELSIFLTHILGKRTNPSAVMAISFPVIILIGSLLLIMPNCTIPFEFCPRARKPVDSGWQLSYFLDDNLPCNSRRYRLSCPC